MFVSLHQVYEVALYLCSEWFWR